jgi:hypothetical protein
MTAWPNDPFTVWCEDGPMHSTTPLDWTGRRRCSACYQTAERDDPPMTAPCPGPALCAVCRLPRGERHHSPDYIMHRVPWDIPRHPFEEDATA